MFAAENLPLLRHELFHTTDVDEARERVAQVFCPHVLLPTGQQKRLDARHHSVRLHQHVSLNYVQYGPSVTIEPGYLENFYLLQIPLSGGAWVRCGAEQISSDPTLATLPSPTEKLAMRWGDDSPHLIVQCSRQAVHRHWQELSQSDMAGRPLVFDPAVALQRPDVQPLLGYLRYLYQCMDDAKGLAHPLLAAQAEQHLISTLLLTQRHSLSAQMPDGRIQHAWMPRSVRRACDFMAHHADQPLSLGAVCAHVGVSARTLQAAFRQHIGCTPLQYLRDLRLDRVRRRLVAGGQDDLSVAQVAMDHGFMHMGHFAGHYLRRFGEKPHQTLRQ